MIKKKKRKKATTRKRQKENLQFLHRSADTVIFLHLIISLETILFSMKKKKKIVGEKKNFVVSSVNFDVQISERVFDIINLRPIDNFSFIPIIKHPFLVVLI